MNNHSTEQFIRDRICRLHGKEAQQLFWDLLICQYPDLQTPKMQHDLGNDGYTLDGGFFFASYVPETEKYDNNETEGKITGDYKKFEQNWKPKLNGKIKTWVFLTRDNLMGGPHQKIIELNSTEDGLKKEHWGLEQIVKLALGLESKDILRIFELPSNIFLNQQEEEEEERTVIDEIFNHVVKILENYDGEPTKDYLKLEEKIKLNFSNPDDQEAIRRYFGYALTKVCAIEARIKAEDTGTQEDLQSHIFGKYYELKTKGLSNMDIMHELFKDFIPPHKENDPLYSNLAKAFVLFHFDDCTIFEKIKVEAN